MLDGTAYGGGLHQKLRNLPRNSPVSYFPQFLLVIGSGALRRGQIVFLGVGMMRPVSMIKKRVLTSARLMLDKLDVMPKQPRYSDSCLNASVNGPVPSHAQFLRVIGQRLHNLGVNSFALDRAEDQYIVRILPDGASLDLASANMAVPLVFNDLKFRYLEMVGRQGRARPDGMPDARSLASCMRVLGGYLDRKAAREFSVFWSTNSVQVGFARKTKKFSIHQNFYDLGICMYLRRFEQGCPSETVAPSPCLLKGHDGNADSFAVQVPREESCGELPDND